MIIPIYNVLYEYEIHDDAKNLVSKKKHRRIFRLEMEADKFAHSMSEKAYCWANDFYSPEGSTVAQYNNRKSNSIIDAVSSRGKEYDGYLYRFRYRDSNGSNIKVLMFVDPLYLHEELEEQKMLADIPPRDDINVYGDVDTDI